MRLALPSEGYLPDRVLANPVMGPHSRLTVAELEGPGCIRHLWFTVRGKPGLNRHIILRIWWDGEDAPSVEAPLGDFFGLCHAVPFYPINCRYLSVQGQTGMNCYFPMPFAQSARIEIETGPIDPTAVFHHVDWHRYPAGGLDEPMRFHAKWRREFPCEAFGEEYEVMEAVGRGFLAGFVYGVRLHDGVDRWSHGGAENIYLDGEGEPAFLRGSGGEDTFGASYGGALHEPESHLYAGMPYYTHEDTGEPRPAQRVGAYRFFEEDSIPFQRSLQFRFGCLANDICSTAYWYQEEPHHEFFRMPPWDKMLPGSELRRGECDVPPPQTGEWWLCGPFENAHGEAMAADLPPELEFEPAAVYEGGFGPNSPWQSRPDAPEQHMARWVRRAERHHFVDFNHVFRPRTRGVSVCWPAAAVAATTLRVPEDTSATLHIAWDDELTLRVNGEGVLERERHAAFRRASVPVRLRRGDNRVTLKLSNTKGTTWGAWCFAFRAEGKKVSDTFSPNAAA